MINKICLITGASKGIGWSIVKRLLESGAIVCATSSNSQNLSNLKNDFDQYKENLHTFIADLTSTSDVNNLCESVSKKIGDIDILINNAGVLHLESLENSSDANFKSS